MPIEAAGPNAEQIKYWNEVSGPKWVALSDFLDRQLQALGDRALARANVRAGENVLDVGCGCGATTLELARRAAPGSVKGVDISAPMLERAAENARAAGVGNASFENADAQLLPFAPSFDLVFSRFGVMFFADPREGFANLRRSLRPDGRLTFICWQQLPLNPWMFIPFMAAAPHLTLPPPPPAEAPGPFALADPERLRNILGDAGYRDVDLEDVQTKLTIGEGESLDRIVELMLQIGPTGSALRQAPAEIWPTVTAAVRNALQPFYDQGLRMDCAAWIVTGRG